MEHVAPAVPKSSFALAMEAADEAAVASEQAAAGDYEDGEPNVEPEPVTAPTVTESDVTYWSDYLKAYLHPKVGSRIIQVLRLAYVWRAGTVVLRIAHVNRAGLLIIRKR